MNLPEFVFISSKEITGGELILQTINPYPVFRVYKFEESRSLENFMIKYNLLNASIKIPGFNIIICLMGNIDFISENPVLGHNVQNEILHNLNNLSAYYEKERIRGNETRLKKYANKT